MKKILIAITAISTALTSFSAFSKCNQNEKTVFSCLTKKKKQIEVCDAGKTISYSFGFPNQKPEIVVSVPRQKASTYQDIQMKLKEYRVNVPNGKTVYSVYYWSESISENPGSNAGVYVKNNGKQVADVECDNPDKATIDIFDIDLPLTNSED